MKAKQQPTQYGPTRSRLTKQQTLQLKGTADLAEGDLISPTAACRQINDNSVGLYVAKGRIASWCSDKTIPCQSYIAEDGRSCYLLYTKHVAYLKDFLIRVSTEQPSKWSLHHPCSPIDNYHANPPANRSVASNQTDPTAGARKPLTESDEDVLDRSWKEPEPSRRPESVHKSTDEQLRFTFPETAPDNLVAKTIFDALKIADRLEKAESRLETVENRYRKSDNALEFIGQEMEKLQNQLDTASRIASGKYFALKELWEQVADLRKELDRRNAEEETATADRINALQEEKREILGEEPDPAM